MSKKIVKVQNAGTPKLTAKEELFCYEYCIDFNASRAARAAGYSAKTAYMIGFENLRKPKIQDRIRRLQDNLAETAGISALKVLKEYEKIAFSSIAQLHNTWVDRKAFEELTNEQKACIKNITTKVKRVPLGEGGFADVEFVKVELHDKVKSLDSIREMLGFSAPVKSELTGKGGKDLFPSIDISKLSDEEIVKMHTLLEKAKRGEQ